MRALTSKLLSETSKLRNETWKLQVETSKSFQIFLETFISEFGLFFKLVLITWFTEEITKFVERKFQGIFQKFYKVADRSFEVSFSTSKFPIRVLKLGCTLESL